MAEVMKRCSIVIPENFKQEVLKEGNLEKKEQTFMSNTVSCKQSMPRLQKSSLFFSILKIHQQSKRVYIYKTSKKLNWIHNSSGHLQM